MSSPGRSPLRAAAARAFAFLGSLRLATILLILLTLAAIIGGILPQAPITPNVDEIYRSYGTFWYRIITRLALDDVFHSGWFLALAGLFALNLALCTGRRARQSVGRVFWPPPYVAFSEDEDGVRRIAVQSTDAEAVVQRILRQYGMRRIDRARSPDEVPDDVCGEIQLIARRWRWGALSPDLVHIGILIILAGALLGFLRQEGTLIVNEWEKGLSLPACVESASVDCIPLAYDVRVDDFGIETYDDSSRVKTYWADLSFLRGVDLVRQGRISVNHPLTVDGLGFYPWRYGDDVAAALVRLHMMERKLNAVTAEIELRVGETVVVPGTQLWLTALRFYRTFALTDDGEPVDLGNVSGGHSAVLLQITGVDDTGSTVAYRDLALPFVPETDVILPRTFLLADAFVPAFLEIHYVRSPGYPVVWWGFVLLLIGLAGAFYFRSSQIRASIKPGEIALRAEGRGAKGRSTTRLDRIEAAIRLDLGGDPEESQGKEV